MTELGCMLLPSLADTFANNHNERLMRFRKKPPLIASMKYNFNSKQSLGEAYDGFIKMENKLRPQRYAGRQIKNIAYNNFCFCFCFLP